ncbi:Fc.00g095580.m01.CDS01 [Cosmosporella sp. VM-42]
MQFSLCRASAAVALLALASAQVEQSLSGSISQYPSLSLFRSLLKAAPDDFDTVLSKKSTNITILIPTDDAITKYLSSSGVSDISELKPDDVQTFFSYHIMAASLKSTDFEDRPDGMTIPTLLQGQQFNNRTAGSGLEQAFGKAAGGQVLVASTAKHSGKRRSKRQLNGPSVTLRAGLAQDVVMTAVDGEWGPDNVNSFQTVDNVLAPPRPCSTTVRSAGDPRLSGLDTALNRTELWPALDSSPNVTCLAPSTEAFNKAGDPQLKLGKADLTGALLAHTLSEVTYTDYLEDGQVLGTLNKTTVRVHIKSDGIYFNNAKVIKPNVLTNNGLIHILDSLIGADEAAEPSGTSTSSGSVPSPTTVASPSSTTNGAARTLLGYSAVVGLLAGFWIM